MYIRPILYKADSKVLQNIVSRYRSESYSGLYDDINILLKSDSMSDMSHDDRLAAARLKCELLFHAEKYQECLQAIDEVIADGYVATDDVFLVLLRGWVFSNLGHYDSVIDLIQRTLKEIVNSKTDVFGMAAVLHLRGRVRYHQGMLQKARRDMRDSVALYRSIGDPYGIAITVTSLSNIEKQSYSLNEAYALIVEGVKRFSALGLEQRVAWNYINMAVVDLKRGDYSKCRHSLTLAGKVDIHTGKHKQNIGREIVLVRCDLEEGSRSPDIRNLIHMLEDVRRTRDTRTEVMILETLSDCSYAECKPSQGEMYLQRANQIVDEYGMTGEMKSGVLRRHAVAMMNTGGHIEALEYLKAAYQHCKSCCELYEQSIVARNMALCYLEYGQCRTAYKYAQEAYDISRDHGAYCQQALNAEACAKVQYIWYKSHQSLRKVDAVVAELALEEDIKACELSALSHIEHAWSYITEAYYYYNDNGMQDSRGRCKELMDDIKNITIPIWARKLHGELEYPRTVSNNPFIANAPSMKKLLTFVEISASTMEPVLVTGETGTGKELIAKMIHERSGRAKKPFVAVNCAAIPETLFEREFFGHDKGAYTGADYAKPGLCDEADGGTLFLDEIGDMPSYLQVKLLRLLQEGTYRRLGDPEERHVDLRIVAATNAPLPDLIEAGRFRQDLYYRLQTLELPIPPLRERPEDLEDLMNLFVQKALGDEVPAKKIFARQIMTTFRKYPWPGNVRELEAMTRRMALLARHNGQATLDMLPEQLARWREGHGKDRGSLSLSAYVETAERGRIGQALVLKSGNRSEAARALGISRNQLYRKMDKLGIRSPK
jgi:transcriptional regulator with PAS, ATPase and Fis domain